MSKYVGEMEFSGKAGLGETGALQHPSMTMKIAFVGNTNNNSFSMMRYFRDLGADAHLLLYTNDGAGVMSHFSPDADTWEIGKWGRYIHKLGFINGKRAITGAPHKLIPPPSKKFLLGSLDGYDAYIGSGIAPAIMSRIGKNLDIFFPYSTGIEYVDSQDIHQEMRKSRIRRPFLQYLRRRQINGILRAKHCLNAEMSITAKAFESIGRECIQLAIPMVYNREPAPPAAELPSWLVGLKSKLSGLDLTIFAHARQMWVRHPHHSEQEYREGTKNSDWLFRGFAEFLKRNPNVKSRICAVEYGPDVDATKGLCSDLGIQDSVIWLPKMQRREIMCMLGICDIGVGEFYTIPGMIWGGTGWEVLASGKPLLQAFNFTTESFVTCFGHLPPPILNVQSAKDVAGHLEVICREKGSGVEMGRAARDWFDRHNGISLAKKWLSLIVDQ